MAQRSGDLATRRLCRASAASARSQASTVADSEKTDSIPASPKARWSVEKIAAGVAGDGSIVSRR
jgi:hypothetical protein